MFNNLCIGDLFRNNVDIFEIARKKEAAPVRRPPAEANRKNVDDFKALKNKGN